MNHKHALRYLIATALCLVIITTLMFIYFFANLSRTGKSEFIYIDKDDDIDSIYTKLEPISNPLPLKGFMTLARHFDYPDKIRTGKYKVGDNECALKVLMHFKNGIQEPVRITIPSVRTIEDLSSKLSRKLMADSIEIDKTLKDSTICAELGYDTCTIISLFIPNTYDLYWNTSPKNLLLRMNKEYKAFWNDTRRGKAENIGLSQTEIITLASIIDEETANDKEKPIIAGMYYNRIQRGIPLQADPTVKFALKDFGARRVYNYMLETDSPYNTYKNAGLPPGPIRIPTISGIDAVLNMVKHNYIYMCAKEDFSGTHNFAETYSEHQINARKYVQALNKRGIR